MDKWPNEWMYGRNVLTNERMLGLIIGLDKNEWRHGMKVWKIFWTKESIEWILEIKNGMKVTEWTYGMN